MKKLAVANGQYTTSQGETKTKWVNVGVIGVSQNGKEYMLIDPTINFAGFPREDGKNMVMVAIFEDSNKNTGADSTIKKEVKPLHEAMNLDEMTVPF